MKIKTIQSNILDMPERYVFAHNIDGGEVALGAGVALVFRKQFPHLREDCLEYKKNYENVVGKTYRYKRADRVVYNMFTKPHVWKSSKRGMTEAEYMSNQEKCLQELKKQMLENGEQYLAIPKIGCGLDGCDWIKMEALIKNVFADADIFIVVCAL